MPKDNPKIVRAGRGWRPPQAKPKPKPKPPVAKRPQVRRPAPDPLAGIFGPYEQWVAQQLAAERARASGEAAKQQALSQGYAKWYAENIPQQIQQLYGNAANTQVGFAKGFSDGMKIAQDQAAGEANKIIANAGGPEGQMIRPTSAASDVLYGTGGYIPGQTLSTQGAAFGSAAAIQAGALGAQGGVNARKILEESGKVVTDLLGKQAELKSKKAEARLKLREQRQKNAIDLYNQGMMSQRQLAKALGLPDWRKYPNIAKGAGLSKINASASKAVGYLVDEYGNPILDRNGKPIPIQQEASRISPTLSAGNGYLTDVYGNPVTDKSGQPIPYTPPASASGGAGKPYIVYVNGVPMLYDPATQAVSPLQGDEGASGTSSKDIATARTLARKAVKGVRGTPDAYGQQTWKTEPIKTWQAARDYLVSEGVDPAVAAWALWPYRNKLKGAPKKRPPNPKASAAPSGGTVAEGNIIPASFSATHPTSGLEGYPATDWFRPAGSVVGAPVAGRIVRVSGGAGTRGKGIYGWSLYIQGDDGSMYFLTHFGDIFVKPGQRIRRGQRIGTVADYGDADHIHVGRRAYA